MRERQTVPIHRPGKLRRRLLKAFGLCSLLWVVVPARAELALYGGNEKTRAHLRSLIEAELTDAQPSQRDFAVTVGAQALADFCAREARVPVLATYLYANRLETAGAGCQQSLAALPVDPPVDVLLRLASALFPESTAARLVDEGAAATATDPTLLALPIPENGVARGLGRLVSDGQWDVFLMPVDPAVFRGADYRLALETLFRHRKPAIVSVQSLLSQGAVAAAFYSQEALDSALRQTIRHWVATGEWVAQPPTRVEVQVNETVLRHGYGRVLAEREARALEVEVNSGE